MDDLIRRSDAIRIASGYCHWSNIPKELAKLPSVNPIQCEDVISRQAIIDSLHSKFVDGFDSDRWWNSMSVLYAINKVPSVSTKKPNRCGDLISREETLTAFADYVGSGMSMNDYDALWDIVAKMPSVKTQEPCKDAISRQAVLEGLASIAKAKAKSDAQKSMMGRTMFFVEQLPSVSTEKTGRWIPVSERLPDIHNCFQGCLITNKHKSVYKAFFTDINGKQWWSVDDVIAWMPLPQPYTAESEEV